MVKLILKLGANPTQKFRDSNGATTTEWVPIAYAMTKGTDLLDALLEGGADPNMKFERADALREHWTPLGFAIQADSVKMVLCCSRRVEVEWSG